MFQCLVYRVLCIVLWAYLYHYWFSWKLSTIKLIVKIVIKRLKVHVVYHCKQNCTMNLMVRLVYSSTVSSSSEQKIIWRQMWFPSLKSERARYYMTELQKFNKNITFTLEGAVIYDCMNKCTRDLMVNLVSSSTEQKIIWRQLGFLSPIRTRALAVWRNFKNSTQIFI